MSECYEQLAVMPVEYQMRDCLTFMMGAKWVDYRIYLLLQRQMSFANISLTDLNQTERLISQLISGYKTFSNWVA